MTAANMLAVTPWLIGLTGAAGSGKDSAAAVLCACGWKSIAFADSLRLEVAAAWRIDERLLMDRRTKELPSRNLMAGGGMNASWLRWVSVAGISLIEPRSPRWVMQQWGSFRRQADPLYWLKHVSYWVQYQRQHGVANLAVTDVRFENEASSLRGLGGHIVRVHRADMAALSAATANHESERHIELRADADLHNDGDLQHLAAEVARVLLQLSATMTLTTTGPTP